MPHPLLSPCINVIPVPPPNPPKADNPAAPKAATATALETARNINGVSFDGTGNITTLTAGTGVSVSNTEVSIGQAVTTSDSPTFAGLTVSGAFTSQGIDDNADATAITINSNEQVGLGTTPPTDTHATWSQFFIGQKGSLISEKSGTGGIYGTILSDNLYIDSDTGSPANIVTNESSAYIQEAGIHKFYSQASGSAGAAVTLSEKMQIDSSGNAIFTKSGGAYLQLKDASAVRGAINVETSDGLVFTTGSSFAERMRINDAGDVLIGGTQEYNTLNGRGNLVVGSGSGNEGITIVTGTSNTGGINFADGTSGDAAYRGYIEYRHDLDAFVFGTSATERMRIDSSGAVLMGTTTQLHSSQLTVDNPSGQCGITLSETGTSVTALWGLDSLNAIGTRSNHAFNIRSNDTNRMTFDSSGKVFIGLTAQINSSMLSVGDGGVGITYSGAPANYYRQIYQSSSGNLFFYNGSNQGYIDQAGAFNDASDERIKKDIEDISYGLDTVKALKPRKYKMKLNDDEQIGFIAQEVESLVPEIVNTDVTPDGDEQKGMSYGHLTAVLTKAIQEQQTQIEALQSEINTLKGGD